MSIRRNVVRWCSWCVVVGATSLQLIGCGWFYADPDPDTSQPEPKPVVNLKYYTVSLVSSGTEVDSGCVASSSTVENDDVISFRVPKAEEYRVDIRESSFYGNALTAEAQRQACERHDGTPQDWFFDPRCMFSTSDSHVLVGAEVLDQSSNVVSTDAVALDTIIDGAAMRFVMLSSESRQTEIMYGNSICGRCCDTQYKFDIEVY
jgi:hypothetical protein